MTEYGGFDAYTDKTATAQGSFGGKLGGLGMNYKGLFSGLTQATQSMGAELGKAAHSLFSARAGGIRSSYQSSSTQLEDRMASQGIDPLFAQGAIEENRADAAAGIDMARGEANAEYHKGLAGVIGQDIESRASLSLAQRQQKLQYYLARLQYGLAKRGQNAAIIGDIAGLAVGGATAFAPTGTEGDVA